MHRITPTVRRVGTTAAALTIAATGLSLAPAAYASGPAEGPGQASAAEPQQDRRAEIISRAQSWVDQGVPYSMNATHPDPNGKPYRTDCSGFVSMAWGLNDSLSTVTLVEVAHPIAKEELQPGDIIMRGGPGTAGAAGHVAIFNGWADEGQTVAHILEEAGNTGAVARDTTYPYDGNADFVPYRLNDL